MSTLLKTFAPTAALGVAIGLLASIPTAPVSVAQNAAQNLDDHDIMEFLPIEIIQRRRGMHNRVAAALAHLGVDDRNSSSLLMMTTRKWPTGATLTVAFNGGTPRVHQAIARAAQQWAEAGNIKFDFGRDEATGQYRTWSEADTEYAADIRVSFDRQGYYSAEGTESVDPGIVGPDEPSLNLQGYDTKLPLNYLQYVRHEFGHAVGLKHEHQRPDANCGFHFDDDPGYVPTTNPTGEFIADMQGRRPGIYRHLGGPPAFWRKETVDNNLGAIESSSAFGFGPFDKDSIMMYSYYPWQFNDWDKSPCYIGKSNMQLSQEDRTRFAEFYPKDSIVAATDNRNRAEQIGKLMAEVKNSGELLGVLAAQQARLRKLGAN